MRVSNNRGNSVLYGGASLSSLKNATGYVSKLGSSYTAQDFSQYLDIVRGVTETSARYGTCGMALPALNM